MEAVTTALNTEPLQHILWDFTGAGKVAAEGQRVVQPFDLDKAYHVSLLVTDASGRRRAKVLPSAL